MADTALLSEGMAAPARPRVRTRAFVLVCLAGFLGAAHSSLLTPILPLFIQAQGGSPVFVGVVVAAFSAPSVLMRPFLGRVVDTWSARGVLGLGSLAMGLASFGYLVYYPLALLAVRAVHGVAWAGFNTGSNVLLARIAPAERRGEAVGYYVTAQGVAFAAVPATALWLLDPLGFGGVFLITAGSGLLTAAVVLAMPRQAQPPAPPPSGGFWRGLVEPSALLPCALDFLGKLPYAASSVFIPLYATYRGIAVESLLYYFLACGIAGLAVRGWFGGWSDRIGRGWSIALGTSLSCVGLLLIAQAADIVTLTLAGVLFQIGQAAASPAVLALAIDRSRPERRGAAMATYSLAFQVANGGGGLLWGTLIEQLGYREMYLAAALAPLLALMLLIRSWGATRRAPHASL
ncbi:MAG TPA: MFS transporter [Chloroflexota bacterium]|nr:MFS transporter [Chloroflexota bacterium]